MKTKFKIFQKNNLEKLLKNKNFRNNQNYIIPKKLKVFLIKKKIKRFLYISLLIWLSSYLLYLIFISWYDWEFMVFLITIYSFFNLFFGMFIMFITNNLDSIFSFNKKWKIIYWDKIIDNESL